MIGGAENSVARLHVGEVEVRAHVRKQRQQFVADHATEIFMRFESPF